MITDKDPIVAHALDALVPPFGSDVEELLASAQAEAGRLRAARNRRRATVLIAFAVFVLLAGAAIAAAKLDLIPFLHTDDRNAARFSVDGSRVYRGASPAALHCPHTRETELVCNPSSRRPSDERTYLLVTHVVGQPQLTRRSMLAQLATATKHGVRQSQVASTRADLARVSDSFIASLNTLFGLVSIASDHAVAGHPGLELVPPNGVPTWIVCEQAASIAAFRCHDLAASTGVAVGTPIYGLQPSTDWRAAARPKSQPYEITKLVQAVLHRPPTSAELRVMIDVLTLGVHATGPHNPQRPTTTATP